MIRYYSLARVARQLEKEQINSGLLFSYIGLSIAWGYIAGDVPGEPGSRVPLLARMERLSRWVTMLLGLAAVLLLVMELHKLLWRAPGRVQPDAL